MHWWRRYIIISLKSDKRSIRSRNCVASIDYCRRPSAIVCDMDTKFELLE